MTRHTFSAVLVALALCGPVQAQPLPTPPAPSPPIALVGATSVPSSGMAVLSLSGSYTSAAWLVFPDRTTGAQVVSTYLVQSPNPGSAFLFSGKSGSYDVAVFAVTPAGASSLQTVITIGPGTPGPQPPKPPTPPDPQPPIPPVVPPAVPIVTGKAWAIGIFDVRSASYTAPGSTQPAIKGSKTLDAILAAPPTVMVWRNYDITQEPVQESKWGQAVIAATKPGAKVPVQLPALVIVDQAGNAVGDPLPLPTDEAGIVAVARRARGLP